MIDTHDACKCTTKNHTIQTVFLFDWLIDWCFILTFAVFQLYCCVILCIQKMYITYRNILWKQKPFFFYFALNEIVHLQNIFFYFISAMMSFLSWWVHILRTIREQHHHTRIFMLRILIHIKISQHIYIN